MFGISEGLYIKLHESRDSSVHLLYMQFWFDVVLCYTSQGYVYTLSSSLWFWEEGKLRQFHALDQVAV